MDERLPTPGRAFALYSLYRLGLLLVSVGVLYVIGVRQPLFLVGAAVLLSALLSLLLLKRQRDAFTTASVARAQQRREQREQRRARLGETSTQPDDD